MWWRSRTDSKPTQSLPSFQFLRTTRVLTSNKVLPSIQQLLLVLLFAGLLSLAFLDHQLYYLAWFAFVPLLYSVEHSGVRQTYILGLIAGLASFTSGMYWIVDFILISKGYTLATSLLLAFVYWIYCAHLIALLLLAFRWLKHAIEVHEFVLFPIIVATFTSSFPMLFSMRLGESQINFPIALQAIEFTGVHGLDAIIALVNIVAFRLIFNLELEKSATTTRVSRWPLIVAISMVAIWLIYVANQYSIWNKNSANWSTLKVGIVQPNETPHLGKKITYPGYGLAYPPEMEMTERLSSIGAEIIIWPEAQRKGYLDQSNVREAYQTTLSKLTSSLIFHDMQYVRNPTNGKLTNQVSTALMLDDSGQQNGRYVKMKRIPFGEYVPFSNDGSLVKQFVKQIFGNFLVETVKGKSHQVFQHHKVNIIPLICYETTSASFVANAVKKTMPQRDGSNGSLLVGLSNDGWFGSTHQPYQHVMASVLRAVENRLPLVHVANNGPSIVAAPSGKVVFTSDFQKAGGYLVDVPYSDTSPASFYSKHPMLFEHIIRSALALLVIMALLPINIKHRLKNMTAKF
jgi:apolipoprotein N-acyltransferase